MLGPQLRAVEFACGKRTGHTDDVEVDRAAARKINRLFDDIVVNGQADGIGKPEPLLHSLAGWWSRRIT
ncbi:type II toxin-antitoxin system YoeB family toxin, partial [Nocardia carnea]|uniref:type II toxin-antitoxin system YoeB family toxin n=1 Tax=Nocardia carnea TaxID=37328 RepID=UPI002454CD11